MSKIDKLSILGVRSFDNTRSETIQFHSPLTLIVGLNGSGKTTIIECLKFATTGLLPPNGRNGAFIHDPKLCGEKEVLAQIKIGFRSTEGVRMVCSRNLQLTVKKTARSMKQLEGSLLIIKDGEKLTMSSRVAELNTMMPQYLGVSKAVIDSVIFCHQEESLWPLSEPVKLKQRFDEIFEALKYTKAIDNIKLLQKNQKTALVGFKKDEEFRKTEKDRGDKLERQCRDIHAEIDVLRSQSEEKNDRMNEAARKAEQAWHKVQTASTIVGDLKAKRIAASTKEEIIESIKQELKELSESDDELQRMLDQYDLRVQQYEGELASHMQLYNERKREIEDARAVVHSKVRECGSHEAQKENYDRQLENREKVIKETARSHNIRGFDYEINDDHAQAFMDRVTRMAKEQKGTFERARQETKEELGAAQEILDRINEQRTALNQRKETAKQSIADNDRKVADIQRGISKIQINEGDITALQAHLKERTGKLDDTKASAIDSGWQNSIERDETELCNAEERKEELGAELVESTRKARESAHLDFIQNELKTRKSSLETMIGAHGDRISSTVGSEWTPASLDSAFQRALDQCTSYTREVERQRDGTMREKEQLDFKLNKCKSDLKNKRTTLKAVDKAVRDASGVEPDEYLEELESLEQSRETMRADEDSFKVINAYFDLCIKDAKSGSTCRTCTRKLATKEIDVLVKNIDKMKEKVTTDAKAKADLREVEEGLEAARGVRAEFDEWDRLKHKDIPMLEQEEKTLSAKAEQLDLQLDEQDSIVSERQAAVRDVEAMSRTVQTIVKHSNDILTFETQITELQAKAKSAGLSRSLEQIQDDVKEVNEEAKRIRTRVLQNTSQRDRNLALTNSLELEIRDLQSKINTAQYELKDKNTKEAQVEEYKSANKERRDQITGIDQELQHLSPQLAQAQAKYDDISRRGTEKDNELQAALNKLNNSVNQLNLAGREITAYVAKGGPQQLARSRREVELAKEEVVALEKDHNDMVRKIKGLEDQLRNHGDTKKGISDNLRYRRELCTLEAVRREIAELEKHDAEEDMALWEREGNRWQMERNKLAAEQSSLVTLLKSKDDQLAEKLQDWETDYKDAAKKYKESHIKVETTKACIEDLGRYGGALDKAIMRYHSIKMEEINRIVDELWRGTYQGTDVDTILIRSESENVRSNKSYNYRLCMVKQDTEMDMRGRCSAGQKVLASIIIRLALAECFGTQCGLIALDEPTTNLDRDNIRALAESLAQIIRLRRAQPNFQLIVITHDEEFLRYMHCADFADVYWRVGRNEKQKSQIERQNIAETDADLSKKSSVEFRIYREM